MADILQVKTVRHSASTGSAVGTIPQMDQAFIQQNQIVERYLAGKLPLKGAQDFERFCREHPETITQLGMADRINQALRLLDASGQPEPWAEKPLPFWQKPAAVAAVTAVAVVALGAAGVLFSQARQSAQQVTKLEEQLRKQPLSAAQSTRPVVVMPSRTGPVARSMLSIGGKNAEMADLKFDVSWSTYSHFRVLIDRVDQGRAAVVTNLGRDSNGHLRVALNSSAMGPGEYAVTLEGLDWRGNPVPQAWASFAVVR